jgi:FMN-dependent NADH-azoreductase
MKLLHLDSSILGAASVTRTLTGAIVDRLRATNPGLDVIYRDLAAAPLPHFALADMPADHPILVAMGSPALEPTPETIAILNEFLAADVVVIGVPMYNFAVPSHLKAWLDRIVVRGKTFRYGPNGPEGLAGGKRVILALARGGVYSAGSPAAGMEHAESYLRAVFAVLGITQPEAVIAEGLNMGPEPRAKAIGAALDTAAAVSPAVRAAA